MFEGVVRAADAGRVEEPENDPVDVGALFDDVARRAGDVRDHGPFFVEQAVEQGAFSDVRRSDDGYGDSLLDGVAERKRAAQGVDPLYAGLPVILLVTLGGFLTNAAYCIWQNVRNRTAGEYFGVRGSVLVNNLLFCALAGVLWYSQFFGLEMGKSFLTGSPVILAFSWSILMSLNVIFSNVWGILLKEWKGCDGRTLATLAAGLAILLFSIFFPSLFQ